MMTCYFFVVSLTMPVALPNKSVSYVMKSFFSQFIPEISSLNPITTLLPIIIVLAITAIKDAVDDVVSA